MIVDFISKLFDTSDYPPRWTCGKWSAGEGWLHILSDLGVWSAYLAIPVVLIYFSRQRKDLPFRKIFLLFGAFILLCGTTHLMDAILFWWPAYRLSGLIKLFTGIVSWATVIALFSVLPGALKMRSPEELEQEAAARKAAEEKLTLANAALEQRVEERAGELTKAVTDLRTSEMRYRSLFEASHDGVLLLDPDSQKIIDANPFMTQLLGYPCDELVGKEMAQIGLFRDESASREMFTKLKASGQTRYEDLPLESRDGTKHEVEVVANLYNEAGRSVIQCSVRDISERKKSEILSNRLTAIIASSADAIISTDLDGVITSWNEGAEKIFGYMAEEMAGQSITKLIPTDRLDEETLIIATIRRGESAYHTETLRKTKDGRMIHVSVTASPIKDALGKVIGVSKVARDITGRKLAEAELRDSNQRFRGTFENAAVGIAHVACDGHWLRINTRICEITGYEREELLTKTFQEITHPDDLDADVSQLNHLLAGGIESYTMEKRYFRKDGPLVWVNLTVSALRTPEGEVEYLIAVVEDISKRKASEDSLRASELRMRLATEATGVGVWEWHIETDTIRWDAEMFRIYGVTPTADGVVHYSTWSEAVLPEDLAHEESVLQDTVRRGGRSERFFRIRRASDGEIRHIHAVEVCRQDAKGQTEWVVGTNLDITERTQTSEKLREAKEAAEAANRSKDRFLAVLSHELRTPLTPVLMTAASLEHDPNLRPNVREDMAMIRRNIEMETKLIDDLLDVTRIASGKLELRTEPLDLNNAVHHVCSMCRPQLLGQETELTLDLSGDVGFISGDPARFEQVLWNVLKNAVKFTPRKGKVHVASKRLSPARVEIRITDTGAGIAADLMPRIFDAFEQGSTYITRVFGGLGLGLAISKALVELHGGSIRAESAGAGHGATFIIEVPGIPTPLEVEQVNHPIEPDPIKTLALRLLVVEDNVDTALSLRILLSQAGFTVTITGSVASALALAKTKTFDMLVSDLGLPDATGLELMTKIQDIQPLRGIAMSGYGMEEDIRKSLAAGFSEHLVKPIKIPQLVAAIQRMIAEKTTPEG